MAILSKLKNWSLHRQMSKKPLRGAVVIALEIAVGLGVSLALAFGFLTWRLSEGPVSLGFLHKHLQQTINAELSGALAEFSSPVILKEKDGGIRLRLSDIKLRGAGGEVLASAPLAAVSMSPWGLISGRVAIIRMILIRPTITLHRKSDGDFRLGIINPAGQNPPETTADINSSQKVKTGKPPWTSLLGKGRLNLLEKLKIGPDSQLTHIGVRDAKLVFDDEASGLLIKADNTRLALNRTDSGYTLFASTQFNISGGLSSLSFTAMVARDGEIKVISRFKNIKPSEFAPLFAGPLPGVIDLPVSGKASLAIDNKGWLKSASVDVEAGAGLLRVQNASKSSFLVDEAKASLIFDGASDRFEIKEAVILSGFNRISLDGEIALQRGPGNEISRYDLDLRSNDIALVLDGKSSRPAQFSKALISASVAPEPFEVILKNAEFEAKKLRVKISGRFRDAPVSPEINLQGKGEFIPVDTIKRLWPVNLAPGTREWIGSNIRAGYVNRAEFKIHLPPGEIASARTGIPIPNEHIRLKFDAADVEFSYLPGLPPVKKASGHALLEGDRLGITLAKGSVKLPSGKHIRLSKVNFTIPAIHEDVSLGKTNGHVDIVLAGKTSRILELLDMKPLGYISKLKIKPRLVGGSSRGKVKLVIPLMREVSFDEISIMADATLENASIKNIYDGINLGDGDVRIKVSKKGLAAKGRITLNKVPLTLKWNESFVEGKKLTTRFELAGTLDDEHRKALNLDLTDVMTGPARVRLVARANRGAIRTAHVEANLTPSRLKQDDIKWFKPAKIPAKAVFNLEFLNNGQVRLHNLVVSGKNLKLTGAVRFDENGRVLKLDMAHVGLGPFSLFALSGKRGKNGILNLTAKGKRFDARPLLRDFMSPSSSLQMAASGDKKRQKTDKTALTASFAEIKMLNNVKLKKTEVKLLSASGLLERFLFKGEFDNAKPVSMSIVTQSTNRRRLQVASANGGALLKGIDFYTRVKNGDFDLDAVMQNPGNAMSGSVKLKKFNIVDEPTLKSILNSSELKGGKAASAGGDDVPFNKLKVVFKRVPGVLIITSGLIAGPSIGATVRGKINRVSKTLQLAGTLVPAYGLNAVFGKIPLLGPFLSGRKGEGLIGLTFGIDGPIKHPVITINPASALAPGFLRLLFEFNSGIKSKPFKLPEDQNDR